MTEISLERIKKDALGFPEKAKRLIVHNQETLTLANIFVREVKALMNEVANSYDPIISHAKAEKKKYYDPLKESEKIAKLHIASYLEEQDRIRREAEEKAKREEEERQKKEQEILDRAKNYSDAGMKEEAEDIIAEIPLPAIADIPSAPEVEGLALKQIVDTERINQLVESSKGQIKIPGIETYPVWKWKIVDRKLIPRSYFKSSVAARTS